MLGCFIGISNKAAVHVYLSVRGHLHGGFHEKNIQFHQWT